MKFHEQQFISQQTAHLNSFSTTGEQPEEGVVLAEMEAAKERVREGRKLEEGLFEKVCQSFYYCSLPDTPIYG